jgi:hypothetical protein
MPREPREDSDTAAGEDRNLYELCQIERRGLTILYSIREA